MKLKVSKKKSKMSWAIGNGESRLGLDLNSLTDNKIGCNALYRDYHVDHLICVDRRMLDEALDSGFNNYGKIYTRPDWFRKQKNVRLIPELPYVGSDRWDDPWHWGAGPFAVLLAAKYTKVKEVNLLGFDLHSKTNNVNNIYKDTPNYISADKRAVDPRYWIYQISKIFELFPDVNFRVYNLPDWQAPKSWIRPNVLVDKISNLYYTI
jgi:hypothetical protein